MLTDVEGFSASFRQWANYRRLPGFSAAMILAGVVYLGVLVTWPSQTLALQQSTGSATDQGTPDTFDEAAEKRVLELLFADRQNAGVPVLELNQGLSERARLHALEVAKHGEASSLFPGEMDLTHR